MSDAATPSGRDGVAFLDKDGTLIDDVPYNVDPSRVRFAARARAEAVPRDDVRAALHSDEERLRVRGLDRHLLRVAAQEIVLDPLSDGAAAGKAIGRFHAHGAVIALTTAPG